MLVHSSFELVVGHIRLLVRPLIIEQLKLVVGQLVEQQVIEQLIILGQVIGQLIEQLVVKQLKLVVRLITRIFKFHT